MNARRDIDLHGPDMTLLGGKIVTVDQKASVAEALAIRDGRISAIGSSAAIRTLAGPRTTTIDLAGRIVIPGLIDSHLHAIRDSRSYLARLDWSRVSTLTQALATIRAAARSTSPGSWIVAIGGWDPDQFSERRSPTPRELDDAAPDHPVYVQQLYDLAVLNQRAMQALQITAHTALPPAGKLELNADGTPTGVIKADGNVPTLAALERRLPEPSSEQQVDSTRTYFRALNRVGITGLLDGGGSDLVPAQYQPLFALWRRGGLTLRVRDDLTSPNPGTELSDIKNLTQLLPPRLATTGFASMDWVKWPFGGCTTVPRRRTHLCQARQRPRSSSSRSGQRYTAIPCTSMPPRTPARRTLSTCLSRSTRPRRLLRCDGRLFTSRMRAI